ncbi:hypothetical protein [Porcincola intestinalis]|uniref:hypothetical protein n=1 Tax=Porcincola intestinalis TaxID=2606632 RepID=UPI0023F085AB|nr:hypothetical protein [Porcincola intestinalis]MCI6767524.1 hypothetical protein [Lachnospiraceae bacterium]MDD7059404.1 hypothetical protein [Porcincola intestinalis]MDY5284005.1 hypothetical protein [Porcincola intestinalis]
MADASEVTEVDKKEYQEKLSEINRLIAVEDYNSAAQVADSIDWKRVRNVQTLLMISEVYEAVNRYDMSKNLLLRAYRRSPLGRTVLYRLVECTIALGQFDEAIEYYSEFVQAAPRDNNKYILKYKIYRGRGSSLDEQINILKEYLAQEKDSERWSYELAKLYKEAGRTQECINTCDDLVLWYQSGKYVIKALELKKKIAPLTPRQQEIYDSRFDEVAQDDDQDEESEASYLQQARAERATIQQDAIKSELAEDISRAARAKQQAEAETARREEEQPLGQPAAQETAGGPQQMQPVGQSDEQPAGQPVEQPAGQLVGQTDEQSAGQPSEQPAAQAAASAQADHTEMLQRKAEDAMQPETAFSQTPSADSDSAQPAADQLSGPVDEGVHYDEKNLKQNLSESMKKIISGIGPRDVVDEEEQQLDRAIEESKEDQEEAVVSRGLGMSLGINQPEEKKAEAPKLTIDDILLSMEDKGDAVRRVISEGKDMDHVTMQPQEADGALSENRTDAAEGEDTEGYQTADAAAQPSADAAVQPSADAAAQPSADAAVQPSADAASQPAADAAVHSSAGPEAVQPAETAAQPSAGIAGEQAASFRPEDWKNRPVEDILDAKTRVLPTAEIAKLHEQFRQRELKAKTAGERVAEQIASEAEAQAKKEDAGKTAASQGQPEDGIQPFGQAAAARAEASRQIQERQPADEQPHAASEKETVQRTSEQSMREVLPQTDVREPQVTAGRSYLKPYQRELFSGFLGIGNLEEQIAKAIEQAESRNGDRTSRTGNVLILGGHGCGKTTIATGIAKAVAEDMGTHSVKMARIYAADLNRKDIAATIAKIAGGVLIVEEAGDLEDSIVDQLTTAMEFRTDGMIMILEDEQRYIHDLLMRHPRFTMKFTAQIYIPTFSSQDLVNFGQLYAESQDCTLSEDAREALRARLDAAAKSGEQVSITNVVELTSRAIRNSQKFFRRIQSAKKRYDEQNRVILKAKDLR